MNRLIVRFLPLLCLGDLKPAPLNSLLTPASALLVNKTHRCTQTMSSHKIKRKHFENPFTDYNVKLDPELLQGNEIKETCKVRQCLPDKWDSFLGKLDKYLEKFKKDSSVYTGTAGIAMVYLRKDPNDRNNLLKAKELTKLSSSIPSKRRMTFLCGDTGALAIQAVVNHKLGDAAETKNIIKSILSLKGDAVNYKADVANEYLYGRAGYLFSLLYINKHISPPPIDGDVIKGVIEAILRSGTKMAKDLKTKAPLMYEWHDSYYLGAAHGLTGILYLLLQAPEYLDESQKNDLIRPTIHYLATLKFTSGNYPSSLESQSGDKYVQWCHGAPGFLYLFAQAYKVFEEPEYLKLAIQAGEVVWQRGLLRKGYSICHGVAGNAYCFLELYQTTKDLKHLYRALKFAEWCVDYTREHEEYAPDRPLSLYEGIAGPMYLLIDIQTPMEAKFPGFTL